MGQNIVYRGSYIIIECDTKVTVKIEMLEWVVRVTSVGGSGGEKYVYGGIEQIQSAIQAVGGPFIGDLRTILSNSDEFRTVS